MNFVKPKIRTFRGHSRHSNLRPYKYISFVFEGRRGKEIYVLRHSTIKKMTEL